MDRPSAVCLLVDGLQAGFLGCYGNTWVPTPVIDRLASRGLVFDQAFAPGPGLEQAYAALWHGERLPAPGGDPGSRAATLLGNLQAAGLATRLVTDESCVARWAERIGFGEVTLVRLDEPRAAMTVEETQTARLLAVAAEDWLAAPRPCLLWVHTRGLSGAWDAPYSFRQQFQDKEDPDPPRWIAPPCETLSTDADPDYLLGVAQAYAGQIAALDACLEAFLGIVGTGTGAGPLLALLSPRGFPLGEHGRIGLAPGAPLHEELLHVPWILDHPGLVEGPGRHGGLVHLSDVPAAVAKCVGAPWEAIPPGEAVLPPEAGDLVTAHDLLAFRGESDRALRTPAWFCRQSAPTQGDASAMLFVKPDDRWEVNDVHDRCPSVLEELTGLADRLAGGGTPAGPALPPLSPLAREGLR
jgi:hypothetical protein